MRDASLFAANRKEAELPLELETLPRDVMRSLGFLTRMPIPAKWFEGDEGKLGVTVRAFPIAGALAALPAVMVLVAGTLFDLPVLLTAILTVAAQTATGGGLHEDGLADVADGFFGGKDKARRLEIMKDSRIGAFGAMALMLALMVRVVALAAILQASAVGAALALIAAQTLSRAALVWHWSDLPPAKTDGVAASSGQPDEDAGVFALVSGLGIGLICGLLARGVLTTIIAFAFAALATFAFRQLCNGKIGGHTGDTLGAAAILAELAFLTGLASGL